MGMSVQPEQPVLIEKSRGFVTAQLNRPAFHNSINLALLQSLKTLLQDIETDDTIKVLVLKGDEDYFCNGMDFNSVSESENNSLANNSELFFDILQGISSISKPVISVVSGAVNAGGMGFIAASDIVIASKKASFSLSEALFGLSPACVLPFLMRRAGYQKSLWMTLTTQKLTAQRAYEIGIADELVDNVEDALRRQLLRLTRLECDTVKNIKTYMQDLWLIDNQTRELATSTITELLDSEQVRDNIDRYIKTGDFPWNKN